MVAVRPVSLFPMWKTIFSCAWETERFPYQVPRMEAEDGIESALTPDSDNTRTSDASALKINLRTAEGEVFIWFSTECGCRARFARRGQILLMSAMGGKR